MPKVKRPLLNGETSGTRVAALMLGGCLCSVSPRQHSHRRLLPQSFLFITFQAARYWKPTL
jgi:hypothetical protein